MPNIISGREIVKEFIQDDLNEKAILEYCENLYGDTVRMRELANNLELVKNKLGRSGASRNAAKIILKELHEI